MPTEPAVTASLAYRDPIAALKWLQNAFGFEIAALLTDKDGNVGHAAVSHGDAEIDIMPEWSSAALLGPVADRAQNRRIEIIVVPDLSTLPGFDELNRVQQG